MQIEIAVIGRHFHYLLELDQFLAFAPVSDQTLNRADTQSVLLAKLHQLWQPRHRSVVMQNFTKHTHWLQTGHSRKINGRFRMPGATQHAAILRSQWKY